MWIQALLIFGGAGALATAGAGGAMAWRNRRYSDAGAWMALQERGTLVPEPKLVPGVKTPKADVTYFPTGKAPGPVAAAGNTKELVMRAAVEPERVTVDLGPVSLREDADAVPTRGAPTAPATLSLPFARILGSPAPVRQAPERTAAGLLKLPNLAPVTPAFGSVLPIGREPERPTVKGKGSTAKTGSLWVGIPNM